MSAWAYRECEICGTSVHINHTCKQYNSKNCNGDPWCERKKIQSKIDSLNDEISETETLLKKLKLEIKKTTS
jgi:hypothetical protein